MNTFILGKQQVLRCLLDIHKILGESYPRYILNDLYITDYCVWIQTARSVNSQRSVEQRDIEKQFPVMKNFCPLTCPLIKKDSLPVM